MKIVDSPDNNPLQDKIKRLQQQLDAAIEANSELELLLEVVTEHSDYLENEILGTGSAEWVT